MDPITMATIGTFTWNAISGGIFYDKVKSILGNSFGRLEELFDDEKRDDFMNTLEIILESNDEILRSLRKLQGSEKSGDSFYVKTKNIDAEGPVVIGNGNSIGSSNE